MNAPVENFVDPTFGHIPIASIIPSKTNPRKRFDDADLADLAASIKQLGVCQPILVRPLETTEEYIDAVEIVAGERRYRASKLAGLESIPAICRQMTDAEVLEVQVVENLQRKDVHPIEEAEGYDQLMKLHGYSADQLAEKIGKSRAYIYGRLKLCALVPAAREAFFADKLSASTALLIARIPVPSLQESATNEVTTWNAGEPMSYRRAVEHIQARYMLNLSTAPFSLVDAKLVAGAGSCQACPKRTGNQPELFADVTLADVCTDPDCFSTKRIAHGAKAISQAKKKGIPVFESFNDVTDDDLIPSTEHLWSFDRRSDTDSHRKISDLLPLDQRPEPSGYVKQPDGKVVELYKKNAMQEALEKAGLCETVEQHTARMNEKLTQVDPIKAAAEEEKARQRQAEQDRRDQLAQAETLARITAYRRIREAMKDGLTAEAWRVVASELLIDYSAPNHHLPDVYSWEKNCDEATQEFIDSASCEQLQLLVMDMVFNQSLSIDRYDLDADGKVDVEDEGYKAFATLANAAAVDIDQVRAEVAPAQDEQTEQATPDDVELLPVSIEGQVKIGDRVRMNDDAKGPGGKKRKCWGKEGTVAEILDGALYVIQFGDLPKDRVARIGADEFKRILPVEAAAEDPVDPAAGDRVDAWPFPRGARP